MPHQPELLERGEELATLTATVDHVAGGSGRLVAVEGAAGLGKSRIMAEARRLASAAGLGVFPARGSDLERDFAFGVVRQLFEPALVRMDPGQRAELLSGAASQARVAVLAEVGSAASATGDFAILHGLFWLTANLAECRPLALVVDDLHWADVASLRFLAYLLPRLDDLPVAVIIAMRPYGTDGTAARILGQLTADPLCVTLRPAPLSAAAAGRLVRQVLAEPVEPAFVAACHAATGGNPLLLKELAETVRAEGLTPTAGNAAMVDVLGPRAVAQRVALWLDRLPPDGVRLARAVSVLGDGAALPDAARLAALPPDGAARAARVLRRAEVFRPEFEVGRPDGVARVRFGHPLVRAAIYDGIDPADRLAAHRRAAGLLAEPEQIAAHLIRVDPAAEAGVVATLRRAAADALARGSPDTAVAYLRRCLAEPPEPGQRAEVLWELGKTATLVDTDAAVRDLAAALELARDPGRRAEIAVALGTALFYLIRFDEAVRVWRGALAELGADDGDLHRRLAAGLLIIPLVQPGWDELAAAREGPLRSLDDRDTIGARALDCLLAAHQAWHTDPGAVARALRGLRDGTLAEQVYADTPSVLCGWLVLLTADRDEAIASIDGAIAHAHRGGSVRGLATAHTFRGLAWLWRGQLAEAEADFREALRHVDAARVELGPLVPGCFLADALIEQGRLGEAQEALDALGIPEPAPPFGPLYWYLDSRARLLRQQGRIEQALAAALATGRRYALHGGENPALLAWRAEAAGCAWLLGRTAQACELAEEELSLARRWGAPRALGRALRVRGLIMGGAAGLRLLEEAVAVLEPSPARLEHAVALVELGSALRDSGSLAGAKDRLTQALDLAEICGAGPVRDRARVELRAAGVRPRRTRPTGPAALTPSERRVAELAAAGHSNREIAERLFVTVKTVEIHLTNAYRKIGVTGRDQLRDHLPG